VELAQPDCEQVLSMEAELALPAIPNDQRVLEEALVEALQLAGQAEVVDLEPVGSKEGVCTASAGEAHQAERAPLEGDFRKTKLLRILVLVEEKVDVRGATEAE